MAGIPSLMSQGPVPGQAPQQPMPGMMPKPGASTPSAMVGPLSQMHMQQLVQMMLNPRPDGPPLYAVLTAINEQQKKAQAQAAVQRQMAMSQGQQAAPPVAQEVVSQAMQQPEPVMAAHGGEMQGYAGGGAVAFQTAGAVPPGLMNPDVDEDGLPRGKDERERVIDYNNKIRAAYEQQMKSKAATAPRTAAPSMQDIAERMSGRRQLEQFYKPRDPEAYTPERVGFQVGDITASSAPTRQGKSGIADLDIGPSMAPRTGASAAAQKLGSGQSQQRQQTVPSREVGAEELAAMQQGLSNQASSIRTLSEPSDEERLARQQARQADIARLEEEKKVAREFREGASKQYADVERQVNLPFLENNAQIAMLGAGLTGRRGETASGLLKGIGAIEANKQSRLDAARKEMREDQRVAMQMESVNRQLAVAQQEKAYADMRGDREGSLAAAEKIATLTNAQNKLAYDYRIKQEEIRTEGIKAEAARTSAAKPNETLALLQALFPGQAPSVENLAKLRSAYTPTAGDRQDVAELKTLQGNLQKQVENILLPKPQRDAAAAQLEQVNAKLAQMAGLGGASTGAPTQLPPAALSQLKEGVATTFANGQQWTLKNGQPTQVK